MRKQTISLGQFKSNNNRRNVKSITYINSVLITTLTCRYYHVSHFTDEKTKTHRDIGRIVQLCRGCRIQPWQNSNISCQHNNNNCYMYVKFCHLCLFSGKEVLTINKIGCCSQVHELLRAFSLNHISFITLGLSVHILERKIRARAQFLNLQVLPT